MPWNDPHTATPSLRAWQDAEGFEYECSAAPPGTSINGRRGMESFLLYRQERGESTLCNFGQDYSCSSFRFWICFLRIGNSS